MEVELRLFGEVIRPDYQVMRNTKFQASSTYEEPDMTQDSPLYAIEVKRTDDRSTDLAKGLEQHFKQLRHLCIQHGLDQIYGIYTNYRSWYFTRYDLQKEML